MFRVGPPLSLSEVLPVLSSMGVEVVDERPYDAGRPAAASRASTTSACATTARLPASGRELFQDAVTAVWDGHNEIDGFNALVLAAGLTWRQATLLRAYAKYMRQGGTPFAQDYIEDALKQNVDITRYLVELFEARFDPGRNGDLAADAEARVARTEELHARISKALDDVASLDHDRILRSYLTVIEATLRTNYFQADADGRTKPYISFKLQPDKIPDLPQPRPKFEIFVYSPRVEGVHLRFGAVARGGLRWSDRRDDFRTEVLGLVKAQMVKNAVIVPVGAKGGFFCKQLPDPGDREAWMAEGIACYKTFISGLLDVTDNLVADEVVPPPKVVRHDGDDSYLVVAADKGTATFSDIANGVAAGLRLLARRRVRLRRLGRLRPQGDGHHRPRRVGVGPPALPRARHRLPGRGLHLRRRRRHVRRRVRQRDAALRAHPAGRGVRPPRHLPRPGPRRRGVVRRAPPALRPAPVELAGLRQVADLRRAAASTRAPRRASRSPRRCGRRSRSTTA